MISLTGWFLNQLNPQKLLFMNIDNMENLKNKHSFFYYCRVVIKVAHNSNYLGYEIIKL